MDLTDEMISNIKIDDESLEIPTAPVEHEVVDPIIAEDDDTLTSENSPFSLKLRIDSFYSEKELNKFIKSVERLVRYSPEYKQWVSYIIETLGQNYCALTEEVIGECKIEMHHHPINLFTICKTLIMDMLKNKESFCTFDVATKIIELHFQNKIGYIPLLSDLHEKFHNGFLKLPIELTYGDYKKFMKEYSIDDSDIDKVNENINTHLTDCKVGWKRGEYPGVENKDTVE